jgi:nifR3 family TIM-barrel protein
MNFWKELPTPLYVVAPMADVTDAPFRRIIAKYSAHERADGTIGGPDVMWTEFVAADGLMRATPEGKAKLMADLIYSEEERPIVAQLFSSNEEYMEAACALCLDLGFDGVDINMGCPDKSIEKQGCGSAMIKNPENAKAIIRAAKRGCKSGTQEGIPVSVKTRIGYYEDELERWIPEILSENPAALTIHGRTRKDLSKVPAKWDRIARAVEIRNELGSDTLILGNGDVLSLDDAKKKVADSGADGVMVGRALFGNPWFFHPTKRVPLALTALPTKGVNREDIVVTDNADTLCEYVTLEERLSVLIEHTKLFEELLSFKNFAVMKKHYKAYVHGFPDASHLRAALMEADSSEEMESIVHRFLKKNIT